MNNDYNNTNYEAPVETVNAYPVETVSASTCMTFGIVATALSELGIPGIILGAIGRKKAKIFANEHGGQVFGKAKVGRILSNVGLGLGIGMTVFWVIYFIALIAIGGAAFAFAVSDGMADGFDEYLALVGRYITL